MDTRRRRPGLFLGLIAAGLLSGASAFAQSFPSRPISFIVPYAPGGTGDTIARLIGEEMRQDLGQPVVIENRPGAGEAVAMRYLASAKPDGHTFAIVFSSYAVNPFFRKDLGYDSVKDFDPITIVGKMQTIMVVKPALEAKNLKEFIDLAKANPGKLNNGVAGLLTSGHLTMEMLKLATGIDVVNVPYKGAAPATADLVAGNIDVMITAPVAVIQFVRDNRLRALATSGASRVRALEGVPTISETVPGLVAYEWVGLLAPAGTPREIRDQISAAVKQAVAKPKVVEMFDKLTVEPAVGGVDDFKTFLDAEFARNRQLREKVDITIE